MSEIDLDQYLGTPDAHFNANAQAWYFEFTGTKRPDCDMSFEVFIAAVHELYLFVLAHRDKPIACLNSVKDLPVRLSLTEKDTLVIVDRLLGVLSHHDELPSFMRPFMQIVDHRHDLSPYTEDPDVIDHKWEFSFEETKAQMDAIATTKEKMVYIINLITDFKHKSTEMDELTLHYYMDTGFLQKCIDEVKRIQLIDRLDKKENTPPVPVKKGYSDTEKKEIATKYLHFFSGYNYSHRKIMTDADYELLLHYFDEFLKDEAVPSGIRPLPQLAISNEFIRYTFYLIHKELYGTHQIRMPMIHFIHTVFSQFAGTEITTTKTKFSVKPKLYNNDSQYRNG
ncbi:hypothetical protein [Mucilaginibacter sp. UR6-11]|uniref:hypothetical protein n=1 Tax=Mucilaginibacter sp. UR6-11 TaxID=1435644 RepID=UPI001E328EF9|nr:hypothetical protein [Mucilaginibacter sp. UR6-11]MCC8423580.1 hypothetical protein [Mucilaginibacter sp. UR6-11]